MKQKVYRDKMMFRWVTKNHEIAVGFKSVKHSRCNKCGKTIPWGNTLCDECFKKDKDMSKK